MACARGPARLCAFDAMCRCTRRVTDPAARLSEQLDEVLGLPGSLEPEMRLFGYPPGMWSMEELGGHVTEAERIFGYRFLRMSRRDETPCPASMKAPVL